MHYEQMSIALQLQQQYSAGQLWDLQKFFSTSYFCFFCDFGGFEFGLYFGGYFFYFLKQVLAVDDRKCSIVSQSSSVSIRQISQTNGLLCPFKEYISEAQLTHKLWPQMRIRRSSGCFQQIAHIQLCCIRYLYVQILTISNQVQIRQQLIKLLRIQYSLNGNRKHDYNIIYLKGEKIKIMSNQPNQTNRLNSISSTASTSTASTSASAGNPDGDILKQYIAELFNHYDTEHKGELNISQLNSFFNDLLKSVGLNITFTIHQLYQVIYYSNSDFTGSATPDDVYKIFKFMLASTKNQSKELGADQQQPTVQPMMATQFQYPTSAMQGQYMSPIYNPYLQMQMQYQAQNQQPQNPSIQFNGQNWVYGGYMGMNPYGYRQ